MIGAGVGGLAVAIRLAGAGHHVEVFERSSSVGGKLGRYERDGFRFDTGPSLLTLPHLLREVVDVPMRRLDPIARYRFADGTWWDAPAGQLAMEAAVETLRPGNGADWARFWKRAEAIWEASHGPFLESPLEGWRTLVSQARHGHDLRVIAPWRTLRSLARQYLRDPRLVTFVDRYATYAGSDPRRAPAALAAIPYAERHFGAWYVEGGLASVADALEARAREVGVAMHLNSNVVRIVTDNGRATGIDVADHLNVGASTGGYRCDLVVANADASHVYGRLVSAPAAERRVRRATPSLSGFVLCLAVDRPPPMAHHTVLFPDRYDDEFDDLFARSPQPVRDPAIYISAPDDPRVAPAGAKAWFVLANAPRHGPVDWDRDGLKDRYADRVLELMARRGVEVRSNIRWREIITPADLERRTGAPGGSIYGTSSNGPIAAFLRPANRSPIDGLYLVGGSSHPGGGLPLVLLSARIVANLIGPAG